MTEFQKRACVWWDVLTINEKIFYAQLYPEFVNKSDLIYNAYDAYLKDSKAHLNIVE